MTPLEQILEEMESKLAGTAKDVKERHARYKLGQVSHAQMSRFQMFDAAHFSWCADFDRLIKALRLAREQRNAFAFSNRVDREAGDWITGPHDAALIAILRGDQR